jgi:hypothetical protein
VGKACPIHHIPGLNCTALDSLGNSVNVHPCAGVAYHAGYLTAGEAVEGASAGPNVAWDSDWGGYDWMLHSDQWNLFRSDRVREFYTDGGWTTPLGITINDGGQQEYSDWAVAAVAIYSCALTRQQIETVRGE